MRKTLSTFTMGMFPEKAEIILQMGSDYIDSYNTKWNFSSI